MAAFYKYTRPDGTDWSTGTVAYEVGKTITTPFVYAAHKPWLTTQCHAWPGLLFCVEGDPLEASAVPLEHNAVCVDVGIASVFNELAVVEELPAHQVFGPDGSAVERFLRRIETLTTSDFKQWRSQGTPTAQELDRYWTTEIAPLMYSTWDWSIPTFAASRTALALFNKWLAPQWGYEGADPERVRLDTQAADFHDMAIALVLKSVLSQEAFTAFTLAWKHLLMSTGYESEVTQCMQREQAAG